jgi:murein DD-endopeptidase MepM/ murein hydrolase activator NlpD
VDRSSGFFTLLVLLLSLSALAGAPPGAAAGRPSAQAPSPATILADEQFLSGALRKQEEVARFLDEHGSILATMELEPVAGVPMPAPVALAFLGEAYSVSPSLLLTVAESRYGVLSQPALPVSLDAFVAWMRQTAGALSRWFYDDYYGFAPSQLVPAHGAPIDYNAGNAATYALRAYFFAQVYAGGEPAQSVRAWEQSLVRIYETYFGPALAGRLQAQPPAAADWAARPRLRLPWLGGDTWYYTGGPHNIDSGDRYPLSGLDFQPVDHSGCNPDVAVGRWVVASAAGLTVNDQSQWLKLDHDGDGNAHTGWQTVYGHLANRIGDDQWVQQGDRLGNPSCAGGYASGVHLHFGVKFENVWQPIDRVYLSGWRAEPGEMAYHGTMSRVRQPQRHSCFRPEGPSMDCTHAALTSDNWANGFHPVPAPSPEAGEAVALPLSRLTATGR